jgi:hypothetical protein
MAYETAKSAEKVPGPFCETCPVYDPFYDPVTGGVDPIAGFCRLNPPTVIRDERGNLHTHNPIVDGSADWCGEHPDRLGVRTILSEAVRESGDA